jgi:hypothetical protein
LMGMLSQGANAPSLPAMSNHGSGLGSSILKQFVSDKMGKAAAEDQAAAQLDAARPGIDYARNAPRSYTDPNTGTTTPLSPLDQARYWQASPDASSRKMGQSMMEDILKPSTNKPGYQTMGMPGMEGYKTNALVGPDGSLKPIGEPWQDKSGVQVNVGDKLPAPSSGYMWNKEGTSQTAIPGGPADLTVKALPEKQQSQLVGVNNTRDAISNYRDKLKNTAMSDYLKPDKYADMGTAYSNMMLQAKEAYNLGVLSGPDLEVMGSVITNPMSVKGAITSKEALDRQAKELDRIFTKMGGVSGDARQPQQAQGPTAQKPMPSGWNDQLEAEYQQSIRGK